MIKAIQWPIWKYLFSLQQDLKTVVWTHPSQVCVLLPAQFHDLGTEAAQKSQPIKYLALFTSHLNSRNLVENCNHFPQIQMAAESTGQRNTSFYQFSNFYLYLDICFFLKVPADQIKFLCQNNSHNAFAFCEIIIFGKYQIILEQHITAIQKLILSKPLQFELCLR